MHSFLHFTRSTWWGEFARVEAIIFEGNFQVAIFLVGNYPRGQLSGGQLSSGAIARGAIIQGAIIQGAIIREANIQGVVFLGGNCTRTPIL